MHLHLPPLSIYHLRYSPRLTLLQCKKLASEENLGLSLEIWLASLFWRGNVAWETGEMSYTHEHMLPMNLQYIAPYLVKIKSSGNVKRPVCSRHVYYKSRQHV